MTIGNFFDNVARRGKELGEQGIERMKTTLGGLRGQPAEPSVGNPNVGPGRPSAEAGAYQAERAAQAKSFADAAKPAASGGLRGALSTAGRAAGPAAAALSEGISLTGALSNGENPIKAVGRSALRGGMTMLGGAAGAGLGTLAAPGAGTLAGGAAGAYAGQKVGNAAADYVFGPEAPAAAPAPQAAQPQSGVLEGHSSPSGDYLNGQRLPTAGAPGSGLRTVPVTAGEVMGGTANPAPGQGAFQRTTPGNPGQAVAVGGDESVARDAAQARANSEAAAAKNLRSGGAQPQPGVFGEIAQMQGLRTKVQSDAARDSATREGLRLASTTRGQDITREGQQTSAALKIAELHRAMGNENETRVTKRTEDYVRSKMTPERAQLFNDPATRAAEEQKLKQQTSDVQERIRHTQSLTGKGVGELPEAQHSLLLKANDLRERLEGEGRKGVVAFAQDFVGNKRFDSKNLYSYLPARDGSGTVKPAIPETFGYSVEMGNGNKVKVYKLAGGGFNFTGPNDPMDSEAMELMQPAIAAAQKKAGR